MDRFSHVCTASSIKKLLQNLNAPSKLMKRNGFIHVVNFDIVGDDQCMSKGVQENQQLHGTIVIS